MFKLLKSINRPPPFIYVFSIQVYYNKLFVLIQIKQVLFYLYCTSQYILDTKLKIIQLHRKTMQTVRHA